MLLLVTLTGILMLYSAGTRDALRTLFADAPTVPAPARVTAQAQAQAIDWRAVLNIAQRVLPGAQLRRIVLPSSSDGRATIRARSPDEWNPVGRSQVWINLWRVQLLSAVDATAEGTGMRVSNAIHPLHAGAVAGLTGQWLLMLSDLLRPFFVVTGFLFPRARKPHKRAQTRRGQQWPQPVTARSRLGRTGAADPFRRLG